jgi:molybdopterin biosynthesis enzyme MoaB
MQHNPRKRRIKTKPINQIREELKNDDLKIKVIRTTLGVGPGYDDNVIDSTKDYIDSLLTGKMGTPSAFTISIMEIIPIQDT